MNCEEKFRAVFLAILAGAGARAPAAQLYAGDGVLSARLECERWHINRARFDPEREADRLGMVNTTPGGHPDYDCCMDADGSNDFGSAANEWIPWKSSKPPLAPSALLSAAADKHSRDMLETGDLTHLSPSSNYYPLHSEPYQRHALEGYTNNIEGYYENIANAYWYSNYGYVPHASDPAAVHAGFYEDPYVPDAGHRQAILSDNAREIGLGHAHTNYYVAASNRYWVWDYDTQDFGRRSTNHFFTDTVFHDANTNGVYDEGEGRGGIEVRLWEGANPAGWYDVSQPSGNFAIPINSLPDGQTVRVTLSNTSASPVRVTVPLGYSTLGEMELGAQETAETGFFPQPATVQNVGFRNLTPPVSVASPQTGGTNMIVEFPAFARIAYRIESADRLPATNWLTVETVTATGFVCRVGDHGQNGRPHPGSVTARFYRIWLIRDDGQD